MLKGINKNIVVVKDTGSDYFDEAIFIVNPNVKVAQSVLIDEAKKIVENSVEKPIKKKRRVWR